MDAWSEWLSKKAKVIFIALALMTVILGVGIKKLTLDTDMQNLLGITIQHSLADRLPAIGDNAHDTEIIVYDKNLFTKKNLTRLNALQQKISKLPSIDKVVSLYSMPDLNSYFNENKLRPVLTSDVINGNSIEEIKLSTLSNTSYVNSMINPEATTLAFYVHIKDDVLNKDLLNVRENIETLINQYKPGFQDLFQIGKLEESYYSTRDSVHDIGITGSLTLLGLIVAFSFFFRSPYLGLAPFLTAGTAMAWTLGIMGYLNIHFNVMTSLAAIMTYTVGTMENAHFINAYQKSLRKNPSGPLSQHISSMYRAVLFPLFLTTISTLLGFVFNFFSTITVLKSFAITICLALLLNALLLCILTPALLIFSKAYDQKKAGFVTIHKLALNIYKITTRIPVLFSLMLVAIIGFSFWAAPKIPLEVMPYSYFYENSEFVQKIYKINNYLTGTERLFVDISSDEKVDFNNIEMMEKLFDVEKKIQQQPMTSSTASVASLIAGTFELLFEDKNFYRVPKSPAVFNGFLKHLKKSDDIKLLLSKDDSVARIVITYRAYTTLSALNYVQSIEAILKAECNNTSIRYEIENPSIDIFAATSNLLKVQLSGVSMIYVSIFIIMLFMFRSFKAGIVSIIPNIFPLSSVILALYIFNIPFNVVSVIVLTAVLGMAVDDTLHILYYFKKNFIKSRDNNLAIMETIDALVRPVSITTFTLVLGMSMLGFSVIKASMQYGLLMIIGASAAWIANLTVTPFLLKKINITKGL